MKFAIFGNTYQAKKSAYVERLLTQLWKRDADINISRDFYIFLTENVKLKLHDIKIFDGDDFNADMVLSVGGDGTFLRAASRVGRKNIPILGINTGTLGFLADISPDEIDETIDDIYNGRYNIEDRTVLTVHQNGVPLSGYPYGLNEIAILKRDSSSMISIKTYISGTYVATYQADGLVIATPTGSTAYSLSVGGPIIVPNSNTIVLSPVAPHSLNIRPIIIRDEWDIDIEVESRSHNYLVAIDGRSETCKDSHRLKIKKADYVIKVVKRTDHLFFKTLHNKMMWGVDGRE